MGNSKSKPSQNAADREAHPDGDDEATEPEQLSYYQMIKHGYNELVNAIIRPPRCDYEISHLGPKSFEFCGNQFERKDFDLINQRGLKVVCSMWEPAQISRQNNVLPCVIYMHGNSSARIEALGQLSLVLSLGATLVSFDFCGSGKSDGDYVSLGFNEKDDLKCVIEHLRDSGTTSTIALWGRSMGAATALLHGERDPSIAGMVLDSAFADLQMLAEEMVEKGRQNGLVAPGFVVKIAIRMIRSSVLKTAGFDIRNLSPIEHADRCFIPTLFVAAAGDDFVPPHHSRKIYDKYAGDKNVIIVDGDHNSQRPSFLYDSALIFLVHVLQIPEQWMMTASTRPGGGLPWNERRLTPAAKYARDREHLGGVGSSRDKADGSGGSARNITWHDSMDEGETGYSAEMQVNVREKLFTMFGDRGQASAGVSASSSSSRSNKDKSAVRWAEGVAEGGRIDESPDSSDVEGLHINDYIDSDDDGDGEAFFDWVCTICTVINPPGTAICLTCETARHH